VIYGYEDIVRGFGMVEKALEKESKSGRKYLPPINKLREHD
jgi:hypothetical protein